MAPDDADTVLILSSVTDDTDAICGDLLAVDDASTTNYLSVAFDATADQLLNHWREYVASELPAKTGIVTSGGITRSTTTADGGAARIGCPSVTVTSVPSPGDLTGLGINVSKGLSRWDGDGNRVVVCVDSLTTLLRYVETERAFQFLHTMLARCSSTGACIHAHINPEAHDSRTIRTIESLFDAVAERDSEGVWQFR